MADKPGPYTPPVVGMDAPPLQTPLFGATVVDFSGSVGWGSSASTLSVSLIEDDQFVRPFDARVEGYAPTEGSNDDAPLALINGGNTYIAEGPGTAGDGSNPAPDGYGIRSVDKERKLMNLPSRAGKGLYTEGDFFWAPTLGAPCYFNFNGWKFNGLCISYQREMGSGGEKFSVELEAPAKILEGTQVILGDYQGTISPQTPYYNGISCGIGSYNILNPFGYYENYARQGNDAHPDSGFGVSGRNQAGMIWHDPTRNGGILIALEEIINGWHLRTDNGFGGPLVYQQHPEKSKASSAPSNGVPFKYEIDLSELKIDANNQAAGVGLPRHFRISAQTTSLMSLIGEVCTAASCDFFVTLEQPDSAQYSRGVYGIIKINVIKRHENPQGLVIKEDILTKELAGTEIVSNKLGATLTNNATAKMILGGQPTRMVGVHSTYQNQCGDKGIYTFQNLPEITANDGGIREYEMFPASDMDEARIGSPGTMQMYPVFGTWERSVPAIYSPHFVPLDPNNPGGPQGLQPPFLGNSASSADSGIGQPILAGHQLASGEVNTGVPATDLSANINALNPFRDFTLTKSFVIDGDVTTHHIHIHDIPIDCKKEGYPAIIYTYPYDPNEIGFLGETAMALPTDGIHLASLTELRVAATGDQSAWEQYIKNFNTPLSKALEIEGDVGAIKDFIYGKTAGGHDAASTFDMHNTSFAAQKAASELYDGDIEALIAKVFEKIQKVAKDYMGKTFMMGLPFTPPKMSEHLRVECVDEPAAWTGNCTPSMQLEEAWTVAESAWIEMGTLGVPTDPKFFDSSGKMFSFAEYEMSAAGPGGVPHDFTKASPEKYEANPLINTVYVRAQAEKKPAKVVDPIAGTGFAPMPDSPTITWINGFPFVVMKVPRVDYVDPFGLEARGAQEDKDAFATFYQWAYSAGQGAGPVNRSQRWNTGWGSDLARKIADGMPMKPRNIGIAQRSNRLLYGPWAEGYKFGATELEFNDSLRPENFGGIKNMNLMGQSIAWHTANHGMGFEESGDVEVVGIPTTELGKTLVTTAANDPIGPYITDISVNIGVSAITTSYTMKTWTVNFGTLLKYNEQRIQSVISGLRKVQGDLRARRPHVPIVDPAKLGWEGGEYSTISPNRYGGTHSGTPMHWILGEGFQDVEENDKTKQAGEFFSNVCIGSSKIVTAQTQAKGSKDTATQEHRAPTYSLKGGMTLDGMFRPYCTAFDHTSQGELPINTGDAKTDKYHKKHYDIPGFEDGSLAPTPNVADLNPWSDDGTGHGHDVQGVIGGHDFEGTNERDLSRRKAKKVTQGSDHADENATPSEYHNEYRAIGLKGPMVVVGWGYDVNGHPIPADPNDGTKFLKNHKKRQDKWKAGPVDLRWDDTRKVWVASGGGGGGRGTVWLSVTVNSTGSLAQSHVGGAAGLTYSALSNGSMQSLCAGGCTHDAIAVRRSTEEQMDTNGNLKNRAIPIVLEEPTGTDLLGNEQKTSGGWLGQPMAAGTYLYSMDTGRNYTDKNTGKTFPIHWILQAQFSQASFVSNITCLVASDGSTSLILCRRDFWTEGPVTTQACPQKGVSCA